MRRRLVAGIILTATTVVVVALAGTLASQPDDTDDTRTAAMSDPADTPSPPSPGPSTAVPSPGATADPGTAGPGTADPGNDVPSEDDPAEEDTSEAGPEEDASSEADRSEHAPGPAPEVTPPALVTMPLPDPSTAVGSLVAGFPVQVIPEVPNSVIDASSVATEGSQLQAALSGQTTLTADEVLNFYRTALAELGLAEAPASALDGSTALAFSRGNNNIALTVTAIEGGCRYAVFGTFTAQS